jgi:hypothetical protein
MGALTPSAYAGVSEETDTYGVKIAGLKASDDDDEARHRGPRGPRGPKKVEDCFTFFSGGSFFSDELGSGTWESEEVLFFELITVTIEGYDDEGDVTLTLVKIGDKLLGIGRNSESKLKTYRIEGEADDCGSST